VPPKFVRPCIPTTAKAIPHCDAWLHEPKLDGYRFQIVAAWANGRKKESAQ
jgi:ATP-dependent DNA ligase